MGVSTYEEARLSRVRNGVYCYKSVPGTQTVKGGKMTVEPKTGSIAFRQGVQNLNMLRKAAQPFIATWDGNPDCTLKMIARNYANNLDGATKIGAEQCLNIQARNSGTNLSWATALELNARNDSACNIGELRGAHIRCENYGVIATSNIGLDIEMSDENATGAQVRTGLLIRSTDASAMSAVENVVKVSHTSTNGFKNLFYFNAATGDAVATGSLKDSAAADIKCDAYVVCSINGTPYYLPLYDTLN